MNPSPGIANQSSRDGQTPRSGRRALWTGVLMLCIAWCLATSSIFVDETEDVIVETFGGMTAVYDQHDPERGDRGWHLKAPWPIGIARRFDNRQQLFDPPGREMFTRDKKNVTVNSYICWRIAEPAADTPLTDRPVVRFYRGLGSLPTAEARLDARMRSILSTAFGGIELAELLQASNSEAAPAMSSPLATLSEQCLKQLRKRADETLGLQQKLGIEVVDLQIKRINLPEGNRYSVYERMRTERERIAERYRSAGRAEKTRIESQARRQSSELLARADADAERIRGEGEAEAIAILNRAHAQDPEFYEFQRTLTTYSRILNEKTTLVLSASSRLFQLLTEGVPSLQTPPQKKLVPPAGEVPRERPR